jgi:predicted alpha/beta superfamily hydrolase
VTTGKRFQVPSVQTHLITSQYAGQTYQIQVMQPLMERGANERFPVMYITDGNIAFDFTKGIAHCLQSTGQVRRFILVSIGYPGENPFAGDILRCRDLTPIHHPEIPDIPRSSPIDGVPGVEDGTKLWHGASAFLAFIRKELVPLIDDLYPTVVDERAYFGHSLGGGLGLHALFAEPGLFNRFAISSPGLAFDDEDYGIREARQYIASGKPLPVKVFMTVADQEEFEPELARLHLVSNFYRLTSLLRAANIPQFDFTSQVISGETHVSVWPIAFSHGIQALYGPADGPPTT